MNNNLSIKDLFNSLSVEQFISVIKNYEFTPHTLHLRPYKDDSSYDRFIQMKSIKDVLCNTKCNCELIFLGINIFFKTAKCYFEIIDSDSHEALFRFELLPDKTLCDNKDILELVPTFLEGDFTFTGVANNIHDEVLKTSECIEQEKALIKNQLSNFAENEKEKIKDFLENSINDLKRKGLELFTTQNQKNEFMQHCFSII